jgi:hypothetical protein
VGCEARKIPAAGEVFFLTSTFIERLSPLLWASIAGLDFFALLLTIAKMENKLSGDRYRKGEPIQLG